MRIFKGNRINYNPNSFSWSLSISEGVLIITSLPEVFLGNAIKSLIDSWPLNRAQSRSKPKAIPPWGGVPYLKASNKNPNWLYASSFENPRVLKTFSCSFLSCILIDPPPISTPFITRSYALALTFSGLEFRRSISSLIGNPGQIKFVIIWLQILK